MSNIRHLRVAQAIPTPEIPCQEHQEMTMHDLAARLVAVATDSTPQHDLEGVEFPEILIEHDVRYIGNTARTMVDKGEAEFARRKTLGLLGAWALSQGKVEIAHESVAQLKQSGGFWGRHEARKLRRAIRKSQG